MQKLMLGFAGRMATGKGTATNVVKSWYPGTRSFRFSDSLRDFYDSFAEHMRTFGTMICDRDMREYGMMIEQMLRSAFGPRLCTRGDGEVSRLTRFCEWLTKDFIRQHEGEWTPHRPSRRDLQEISTAVRRIFGESTLEQAIMSRVHESESESPIVVIEGIRRLVDIEIFLKDPSVPFRLTYLKADPFVCYGRQGPRDENSGDSKLSFEQFLALGEQEAELQIALLEPHAHLVIDNTHEPVFPAHILRRAVDQWLTEIK